METSLVPDRKISIPAGPEILAPFTPNKKEECGIFGIFGHEDCAKMAYFGLYALQHRGQESAGIAVGDGSQITDHKNMGLVHDIFTEEILKTLKGYLAIGHVRYSTTGSSLLANAQPFVVFHGNNHYAIGHNGNLVNAIELRQELERQGAIFRSTMDTEIFMHLLARNLSHGLEEALVEALDRVKGAYSLVMCTKDTLIGARDPNGFRPLCLGKLNGSYVLKSRRPMSEIEDWETPAESATSRCSSIYSRVRWRRGTRLIGSRGWLSLRIGDRVNADHRQHRV